MFRRRTEANRSAAEKLKISAKAPRKGKKEEKKNRRKKKKTAPGERSKEISSFHRWIDISRRAFSLLEISVY